MRRRALLLLAVLTGLVAATSVAVAATTSVDLASGDNAHVTCNGAHLWKTANTATDWTVKCRGTATPTPTTTSPAPTSSSPTPTPSTSSSPPPSACTAQLGDGCGPYDYPAIIPMSDGYDTYVSNQAVGANSGTTQTLTATDPGNWSVVANDTPYGYTGVQTFPDTQQLTNDWCPSGGGWGRDGSCTADTPLSGLSSLQVNYSESGPRDAASIWEFAPDVWTDNYPSDVMFWVDTQGRCDPGAYGSTVLGTATFDGQSWTVHRYGGAGAEIIFTLDDGAGGCAQQTSGTVDVKAGFEWLVAHGYMSNVVFSQLNTGFEITSADHTTFTVSSYSITAA